MGPPEIEKVSPLGDQLQSMLLTMDTDRSPLGARRPETLRLRRPEALPIPRSTVRPAKHSQDED
jgi:hypothetical protein